MNKATRIKSVIVNYTSNNGVYAIPNDYYERMATTWEDMNHDGLKWDQKQAAAALLLSVHLKGFIGTNQITPEGLKAMDWANQFLQRTNISSN